MISKLNEESFRKSILTIPNFAKDSSQRAAFRQQRRDTASDKDDSRDDDSKSDDSRDDVHQYTGKARLPIGRNAASNRVASG